MTESISFFQVALIFGSSVLITILVFAVLVWRDYRRDRSQ